MMNRWTRATRTRAAIASRAIRRETGARRTRPGRTAARRSERRRRVSRRANPAAGATRRAKSRLRRTVVGAAAETLSGLSVTDPPPAPRVIHAHTGRSLADRVSDRDGNNANDHARAHL